MATKLVSPESRLLARPSSPSSITSPDGRQRLFSNSLNEGTQPAVFQDLLSRFKGFRGSCLQVLEWYKRAWKEMSEELRLLVDTEVKSPSRNREGALDGKGTAFEGLFNGMKRSVSAAEAMIHSYCFKRRGKYSEAECKQGVGIALERMANDIWRQVYAYVDKPLNARAADALKTLNKQQVETEALAGKLREAQTNFEEILKRHINFSGIGETISMSPEDEGIFKDDRSSEVSSEQARASPFPKDLTAELSEQSRRLVQSFQKFATSGMKDTGAVPARRETDSILRDMLLMVKSSKAEVYKVKEELAVRKFEKQLNRMRFRVDSLCKSMEDAAQRKSTLPETHAAPSAFSEEIKRLRDLVMRQATEIDRLRSAGQITVRVSDTPPSPAPEAAYCGPEIDQLSQTQQSIMEDIRQMKQHMDRFFYSTKDSSSDAGSGRTLKLLKAAAPHIRASNDSEFLQQFIDELVSLRKDQQALLTTITNEGYVLESVEDVGKEFLKLRTDYLTLKEEHDEMQLRIIRVQSEAEIEASYLESRIKFLENELEEAKRAEQSTPESSSPRSHRRISDFQFGSLEEENVLLSSENFGLLEKLEEIGKEKASLLSQLGELQNELKRSRTDTTSVGETNEDVQALPAIVLQEDFAQKTDSTS